MDPSSTHTTQAVKGFLEAHPRFQMHFTTTSASWLHAVDGWFGQLDLRALHCGVFTAVTELRDEIHRDITTHNAHSARPFRWTMIAEAIIEKVRSIRSHVAGGNWLGGTLDEV